MAVLLNDEIAKYEDSHQIHSVSGFPPKVEMKKLVHRLRVVIEGPENTEAAARNCFNGAVQKGLLAAAAAAFLGAGPSAAEIGFAAAKVDMLACMGGAYSVRLDNNSAWEYWTL